MPQLGWTFNPDNPVYAVEETPPESKREILDGYTMQAFLWARTVICRNCLALIPLSTTWELDTKQKLGVQLVPNPQSSIVGFKVVPLAQVSRGTIKKSIATCHLCGTTTPKGYLGEADRAERMGHQQYCEVWREWWPIYRHGEPPMQGKTKNRFRVPGESLWQAYNERWRVIREIGVTGQELEDITLRELGLFSTEETEYAPGVAYFREVNGWDDDEFQSPA